MSPIFTSSSPTSPVPLLLTPEELAGRLTDPALLLVDLGKESIYQQAHVPKAVHVDYRRLQRGTLPAPGLLPERTEIRRLLSEIGLTPGHHVVAYDDEGGGRAARFLWLLEAAGHTKVSVLDGGIHAWLADDLPFETIPSLPLASDYVLDKLNLHALILRDELLERYKEAGIVLWDARSRDEYTGRRAAAQKAGHIPGAVHYEWTTAMDEARDFRLRPLEDIRQELAAIGITPDKEVITYCQTHHRSSFTWFVGKLLGFPNIRGYAGAWSEWGNDPDTPVETSPA